MRLILLFLLVVATLGAALIPYKIQPPGYLEESTGRLQILDTKIVRFDAIEGEAFFGISALAYDDKTKRLYMLSDRGRLFAFTLAVTDDKIVLLKPLWAKRLRDHNGHKFFIKKSDSEGMALIRQNGRPKLLVSFEHFPRIRVYDPDAEVLSAGSGDLTRLPSELRKRFNYRSRNKMLESVAYSRKFGTLTAPEKPLKTEKRTENALYNAQGKICTFHEAPDYALTELAALTNDKVLALMRKVTLTPTLEIGVKLCMIDLEKRKQGRCRTETLFSAESRDGWKLDNFEGLTHLHNDLWLMISDDNGNFFQKTLLVLFRLR